MLSRYRAAFASPGAVEFSAAGFLARLTLAIYPIAIVLIISGRTHSYGYAGVVSGSYVVGGAFGNPIAAVLVDRLGQHRVLPGFLIAHLASTGLFGALITVHAPLLDAAAARGADGRHHAQRRRAGAGPLVLRLAGRRSGTLDRVLGRIHPGRGDLRDRAADRHRAGPAHPPAGHPGAGVAGDHASARVWLAGVAVHRAAGAAPAGRRAARFRPALPGDVADHLRDGVHGRGVRQRRGDHGGLLRPARSPGQRRLGGGQFRRRQHGVGAVLRRPALAQQPAAPVRHQRGAVRGDAVAVLRRDQHRRCWRCAPG